MTSNPPPSPRRHLPQPVEESKRSNRALPLKVRGGGATPAAATAGAAGEDNGTKARRPLPQPVETTSKTTKLNGQESNHTTAQATSSTHDSSGSATNPRSSGSQSTKPKRFAPQMVETSRRSRRNTDTSPGVTLADRTDYTPSKHNHLPKHMRPKPVPIPPDNSPAVSTDQVPQAPESKFSAAKLAVKMEKRHSFRVPNLPAISSMSEANESEESEGGSESSSESGQSSFTEQGKRRLAKKRHSSEPRPGRNEEFTGYLLSLAARAAEKQLREQALAAYPNEKVYEPIDHFAVASDSSESEGEEGVGKLSMGEDSGDEHIHRGKHAKQRSRGDSNAGWDLTEMRQHQKKLEEQRRQAWAAEEPGAHERQTSIKADRGVGGALPQIERLQKDNEITSMRNAASPPMAGANLRFPRCESPRHTRLDVYQYPNQNKSHEVEIRSHSGLWTPGGGASRSNSQSGLWMGVNHASAQTNNSRPFGLQTGLLTPANERSEYFTSSRSNTNRSNPATVSIKTTTHLDPLSLPPSPPSSQEDGFLKPKTSHPVPEPKKILEEELDDFFVTQLYNYLSLGFPSLARPYDEELAKISRMSLETLRQDDDAGNSKGYIGAPEGTGPDLRGCRKGACQRWLALRKYVKEWGRQELLAKGVEGEDLWEKAGLGNDGAWGAAVRKGSWAI